MPTCIVIPSAASAAEVFYVATMGQPLTARWDVLPISTRLTIPVLISMWLGTCAEVAVTFW